MTAMLCWALAATAFLPPAGARADSERDVIARELVLLRREFDEIRVTYEARLAALEARLAELDGPSERPPARQEPSPASSPSPTSLNPQISVIADFLGAANRNLPAFEGGSLDLRELEVAFQANIDPFARADVFLTVPSIEDVEVEEGYITFLNLPSQFLARLGKLRVPFGRANRDHRPESFAVDRPDVIQAYFGEEGLAEMGASLSRLIPNPWELFMEVEFDLLDGANPESFGGGTARDLLYNLHYRTFFDLSSTQNLNLGLSYATGVNNAFAEIEDSRAGRTYLQGVDVTYRWKPLARGAYRSFLWQNEVIWGQRETPLGRVDSWGFYSFVSYQLGRRWYLGGRLDESRAVEAPGERTRSASAMVDFYASEFQRFRLQYKFSDLRDALDSHQLFFQWYFLIGTHGAHKF